MDLASDQTRLGKDGQLQNNNLIEIGPSSPLGCNPVQGHISHLLGAKQPHNVCYFPANHFEREILPANFRLRRNEEERMMGTQ